MTLSRSQVLLAMAITAVILLVTAQVWRSLADISLPVTFSWLALAEGVGLGLGIWLVSQVVYRIWPAYQEAALQYAQIVLGPLQRRDILWLGLLPGLSEELLFRGVALPTLGLVASSLLFGVSHLLPERKYWPYPVWATVIGLVLGIAAQITGNLLVPVIAHVLNNWLSGLLWKVTYSESPNVQ